MISQKTFHVTAYVSLVTVTRNGFAMGKTSTDRQKDLRAKRKAAGLAQMSIWAKATDKELLRDIERGALAGESAADVLRERLQLRPEIREIVKTVEKRVEVPVEKIVERRVEVPVEVVVSPAPAGEIGFDLAVPEDADDEEIVAAMKGALEKLVEETPVRRVAPAVQRPKVVPAFLREDFPEEELA